MSSTWPPRFSDSSPINPWPGSFTVGFFSTTLPTGSLMGTDWLLSARCGLRGYTPLLALRLVRTHQEEPPRLVITVPLIAATSPPSAPVKGTQLQPRRHRIKLPYSSCSLRPEHRQELHSRNHRSAVHLAVASKVEEQDTSVLSAPDAADRRHAAWVVKSPHETGRDSPAPASSACLYISVSTKPSVFRSTANLSARFSNT